MEDNNEFFEQMKKFFEIMQNEIGKAVNEYTDGDELPEFIQRGFKIEIGPNGPSIKPINHSHPIEQLTWEKPLTDVFLIENTFQIIVEVPGIEDKNDIKFHFQESDKMGIIAVFDDYKYRKGIQFKHPIDENSLKYSIRNGVLEIFIDRIID